MIVQPSPYLSLLPTWDPQITPSDLRGDATPIVLSYRRLPNPNTLKTLRSSPPKVGRANYTTVSAPVRAAVDMGMFNSSFLGPMPTGPSLPPSLVYSDRFPFGFMNPPSSAVHDLVSLPPPPPSPRPSRADESHHTVLSPAPLPSSTDSSNSISRSPIPNLAFPDAQHPVTLPNPTSSTDATGLNLYSSNLIFHLGASGLAKERPPPIPPRRERSPTPPPRPRSFPLPDVSTPTTLHSTSVGEDAYFARIDGMCIADGVGGWARSGRGGADAGRWSRLLTHFCEVEVGEWWAGAEGYLALEVDRSKEEEVRRRREAALADEGVSGWARSAWTRRERDVGEGDGLGGRRPLDPVEIMQKGYEKCLACVTAEVSVGSPRLANSPNIASLKGHLADTLSRASTAPPPASSPSSTTRHCS